MNFFSGGGTFTGVVVVLGANGKGLFRELLPSYYVYDAHPASPENAGLASKCVKGVRLVRLVGLFFHPALDMAPGAAQPLVIRLYKKG